jgi:SSS family solute:Na+ symporter
MKEVRVTRLCNVICCAIAMFISFAGIPITSMNTFAFGIRCAGPFAAYGLGLVIPRATKNSGLISIVTGTIGFIVWQILSTKGVTITQYLMPVVFGCLVSVITFFCINAIEWKKGVAPAPSAYESK